MVSCCSINMRIFKVTELILLLLSIVYATNAAPGRSLDDSSITPEPPTEGEHYDQRQNGTENFRVHVDGVVIVIAPAEALLLAGLASGSDSNILAIPQQEKPEKPKPDVEEEVTSIPTEKSIEKTDVRISSDKADGKSARKPGERLMSILSPLLRRVHLQ